MRRAAKTDTTQAEIVKALRQAGWLVWVIGQPCDLLCFKAGVWRTLEAKSPKNKRGDPRSDKRQKAQAAFLAATATPIATDPLSALLALGEYQP